LLTFYPSWNWIERHELEFYETFRN
jgi:hypothetical protein